MEPVVDRFPGNDAARRILAAAWYQEGMQSVAAGRFDEALPALARAADTCPDEPGLQSDLGACHQLRGDIDAAIVCFESACRRTDEPYALENLASAYHQRGRGADSNAVFGRLVDLPGAQDRDRYRIRAALQVPPIPDSEAQIAEVRSALGRSLDDLLARPLRIANPERRYVTPMALSYHGSSNRELLTKLALVFRRAAPGLSYVAPHCASYGGAAGRRMRVGFLSSFFRNHSIGHTTRGLIEMLDRERFEAITIRIPPFPSDPISEAIDRASDRVVRLPETLQGMRQAIAALALDVLFYQDIGMEPMSYFLAFARLAPVQCVSFGHPDTTGIDTVDWFVSGDLVEPDEHPERDYSERLHLLRGVGTLTYYLPPDRPSAPRGRQSFGFADDDHVYLCPQTLFKLHPVMDRLFARILGEDARALVALIAGGESWWAGAVAERLRRTLGDLAERVRFVPRLSHPDYLSLLACADVGLDTVFFNGMNTSLESFAMDLPVVTLPQRLQRGRHTTGMYRRMGLGHYVADTEDRYVELAVRAARDADFNRGWRQAIAERKAVLYRDASVVRQLEQFFAQAVALEPG